MAEKLVTFVHLSDTHLHIDPDYVSEHIDFPAREPVQKLIDAVNALEMDVDFVLHTGDVAHWPETPEHYHTAREILNQIRFPTYYCPGNHDIVTDFQEHFLGIAADDIQPTYDKSFDVNGVQVVTLDTHMPVEVESHAGYVTAEQLDWLDTICRAKDDRPACHRDAPSSLCHSMPPGLTVSSRRMEQHYITPCSMRNIGCVVCSSDISMSR